MTLWREIYDGLLGRELEGMAFMPMTGDMPSVVADMRKSSFWYSGAVCLGFLGAADIFLTWKQQAYQFILTAGAESLWGRFALDRITMSPEEPWSALHDAKLKRVLLFTSPEMELGGIVAARHDFSNHGDTVSFWVGAGYYPTNKVGDGDDLYVGLDNPPNVGGLTLIETIGPEQGS